jgi:predicted nucleotide-binding protein (sugar kinase/HSP70/actin superfamily)
MLLKTRPYETHAGDADTVYTDGVEQVAGVMEQRDVGFGRRMKQLVETLCRVRDAFRNVPARYVKGRPLIGVVGEIFCRLNTFSNDDAVRKIEAQGGEVWLSDVAEWVWYTNWSQKNLLRRDGRGWSPAMAGAMVKNHLQKRDEHALLEPFADDLVGYEEPHDVYAEVLQPGWPYLPADGALGEMVLSVGKSIYLYEKGADGVIDISPFSCMNGIVSEAVYHAVQADHEDMPIRNFYFDASSTNMDRDLDIFMELVRAYQKRKTHQRRYPAWFA